MTPQEKQLLHLSKDRLIKLANYHKVSTFGSKAEISKRVAEARELRESKAWDSIVGKTRE